MRSADVRQVVQWEQVACMGWNIRGDRRVSVYVFVFFLSYLQGGDAVFQNLIIKRKKKRCKYLHFNLCIDDGVK